MKEVVGKVQKKTKFESVKINSEVVDKVRQNKEKKRVPIGIFFEIAALQKLQRDKKKKLV